MRMMKISSPGILVIQFLLAFDNCKSFVKIKSLLLQKLFHSISLISTEWKNCKNRNLGEKSDVSLVWFFSLPKMKRFFGKKKNERGTMNEMPDSPPTEEKEMMKEDKEMKEEKEMMKEDKKDTMKEKPKEKEDSEKKKKDKKKEEKEEKEREEKKKKEKEKEDKKEEQRK
jgi:hypothetical protein